MSTRSNAKFEFLDDSGWIYYEPGKGPKRKRPKTPRSSQPFDTYSDFVFVALVWLSGLFFGLWLYASCLR